MCLIFYKYFIIVNLIFFYYRNLAFNSIIFSYYYKYKFNLTLIIPFFIHIIFIQNNYTYQYYLAI